MSSLRITMEWAYRVQSKHEWVQITKDGPKSTYRLEIAFARGAFNSSPSHWRHDDDHPDTQSVEVNREQYDTYSVGDVVSLTLVKRDAL